MDVLEAALVALADLRKDLQQGYGLHDQVVKVHRVVLIEPLLVELVDLGDVLGHVALCLPEVVARVQEEVLRGGDLGVEGPGVEALWVSAELYYATSYEPDLIRGVVDGELPTVPELLAVDSQDTGAESMKGRDPHLARVRSHQQGHPVLHLAGGLVGEGDGEYLVRRREPLLYEVGDPVREHARLATTCSSEDE